jgi:hypothetical protein
VAATFRRAVVQRRRFNLHHIALPAPKDDSRLKTVDIHVLPFWGHGVPKKCISYIDEEKRGDSTHQCSPATRPAGRKAPNSTRFQVVILRVQVSGYFEDCSAAIEQCTPACDGTYRTASHQ